MRSITTVAAALALGFSTLAASAMPIDTGLTKDTGLATQVRYLCGPGMTRGPGGHCRPRFTCPPGWHTGPHGWHCARNHYWRHY